MAALAGEAEVLLYVIETDRRATQAILEAIVHISMGRDVVLVQPALLQSGAALADGPAEPCELDILNEMRAFLIKLATERGVRLYSTLDAALNMICEKV